MNTIRLITAMEIQPSKVIYHSPELIVYTDNGKLVAELRNENIKAEAL